MKTNYFLSLISTILLVAVTSCGQTNPQSANTAQNTVTLNATKDSIDVETAFKALKQDENFQQSLAMEYESKINGENHPQRIVFGDINADGLPDALLRFTVEGRRGGNNSDVHYAVFLSKENKWKYSTQLNASIFADDRILEIQQIDTSVIKGNWVGDSDKTVAPYAAEYIFRNGEIINTFTALHPTKNVGEEYLYIETLLTPEHNAIPLTGNIKIYEHFLGKGKITIPDEKPECGTYFEESSIRYLDYPNLQLELNDKNEAVIIIIKLNTDFRLQTDKGTITVNTTLENLKSIFQKNNSYMMFDGEKKVTLFAIPDGDQSDNQWHFAFDNSGKLKYISLNIAC